MVELPPPQSQPEAASEGEEEESEEDTDGAGEDEGGADPLSDADRLQEEEAGMSAENLAEVMDLLGNHVNMPQG